MLLDVLGTAVFLVCGGFVCGFAAVFMIPLARAAKHADTVAHEQQDAQHRALLEAKSLACAEREDAEIRATRALGTPDYPRAMLEHAFAIGQVLHIEARLDGDVEGARSIQENQQAIIDTIRDLEPRPVAVITEDHLDRLSKAAWN